MVRFSSMNKDNMDIKETIESLEKEIWNLKKEIDRLNEELQLIEIVEKQHKELNGKLRLEITRLKGGL
jgi:prefoldin subunit 5